MAFDPLTWVTGFALGEAGKRILTKINERDLNDRLRTAIKAWSDALPEDTAPSPTALFPAESHSGAANERPALAALRAKFLEQHAPLESEWLAALVEQWTSRRDELGGEAHAFFLQDETVARQQLGGLARVLAAECKQDDSLFRGEALDRLRDLTATHGRSGSVAIDVGLAPEKSADRDEMSVVYVLERADERVQIRTHVGYLEQLERAGPVAPINCMRPIFKWDFPHLSVKVVNNTAHTIYASEIVLDVATSRVDARPIPIVREDTQGRFPFAFYLVNAGWGIAENASVQFRLEPWVGEKFEPTWNGDYPHELVLGDVGEDGLKVDVSPFFSQAGADLALFHRIEKATRTNEGFSVPSEDGQEPTIVSEAEREAIYEKSLGPFKEWHGIVIGEMRYSWRTSAGEQIDDQVKFYAPVIMGAANRLGVLKPPTYEYDVELETNATDYKRVISISHEIRSGETDHFLVRLGFEKSSHHDLRVGIRYLGADAQPSLWQSPRIELDGFVARRGIKRKAASPIQRVAKPLETDDAPSLRVVDIVLEDAETPTVLDVKVRNTSSEPCFIRAAEIDVHRIVALYTWYRPSLQPVTAEYDVDLDPREETPFVIEVPTSQSIAPHGTDRFLLRVALPPEFDWFVHNVFVHASISLLFNEGDNVTPPISVLFAVRPRWRLKAMRAEPRRVSGVKLAANRAHIDELLAIPGKRSATIESLQTGVSAGNWPDAAALGVTLDELPSHLQIRFGTPAPPSKAKQRVYRR